MACFTGSGKHEPAAIIGNGDKAQRTGGAGFHAAAMELSLVIDLMSTEVAFFGNTLICSPVLDDPLFDDLDGTKWTGHDANLAADAAIFVDFYDTVVLIDCPCGTGMSARRVLALTTLHGNVDAIDPHDVDSGDELVLARLGLGQCIATMNL